MFLLRKFQNNIIGGGDKKLEFSWKELFVKIFVLLDLPDVHPWTGKNSRATAR